MEKGTEKEMIECGFMKDLEPENACHDIAEYVAAILELEDSVEGNVFILCVGHLKGVIDNIIEAGFTAMVAGIDNAEAEGIKELVASQNLN